MTSYSVLNVLCAPSYDNSVRKLGLYSTFYRGENRGFFFFFLSQKNKQPAQSGEQQG